MPPRIPHLSTLEGVFALRGESHCIFIEALKHPSPLNRLEPLMPPLLPPRIPHLSTLEGVFGLHEESHYIAVAELTHSLPLNRL